MVVIEVVPCPCENSLTDLPSPIKLKKHQERKQSFVWDPKHRLSSLLIYLNVVGNDPPTPSFTAPTMLLGI